MLRGCFPAPRAPQAGAGKPRKKKNNSSKPGAANARIERAEFLGKEERDRQTDAKIVTTSLPVCCDCWSSTAPVCSLFLVVKVRPALSIPPAWRRPFASTSSARDTAPWHRQSGPHLTTLSTSWHNKTHPISSHGDNDFTALKAHPCPRDHGSSSSLRLCPVAPSVPGLSCQVEAAAAALASKPTRLPLPTFPLTIPPDGCR
ncbi:hypothetical protein B0T16DRAFT_47817 [Cercophora newfieldiana]|uniref:Uncharacterized protein n=1 Tax=Cercophora newfieldiana TaxID=92897 RepID=A0AA39YQL7_9PEZI|nr:hypothetical protein B0T16DRAFT_47817 [Cercophora newfieldiana]